MRKRIFLVTVAILMAESLLPAFGQAGAASNAVPLQSMAANAEPHLEVATIKPGSGDGFGLATIRGEHLNSHNVTLTDLVKFAYQLNAKQVIGMPEWGSNNHYDIAAVMEPEGRPSPEQIRTMLKKFLQERFHLALHEESKILSVFVLRVGDKGLKLKPSEGGKGEIEREVPGGLQFVLKGTTTRFYGDFLQELVLDRPVVDQTGLTGKYDFDVTFAPDQTMLGGRIRMQDSESSAPSLFTALQDLGLKLTPERASAKVVVIDHADQPSAN